LHAGHILAGIDIEFATSEFDSRCRAQQLFRSTIYAKLDKSYRCVKSVQALLFGQTERRAMAGANVASLHSRDRENAGSDWMAVNVNGASPA
jgi:hypothetical protein